MVDVTAVDLIVARLALDHERDAVKIDESVSGVEDLHVAADCGFTRESVPIQPANALVQAFSERILCLQSEQLTGGIVEISDSALRIGDDDSFLDRVDDGFEKTFLLRQAQKIILHFLRPDLTETAD